MGRIHLLEDAISNQIAYERLSDRRAVKELLELPMLAQHRSRRDPTGADLIRIVDNGHGMGREDATLCLQRHATSKLWRSMTLIA